MEPRSTALVDAVEEFGEELGAVGLVVVDGVLSLPTEDGANWGPVSKNPQRSQMSRSCSRGRRAGCSARCREAVGGQRRGVACSARRRRVAPRRQMSRLSWDQQSAGRRREENVMDRLSIGGVQLEYEAHGSGEPVLLIHGAHIADAMRPLVDEPALSGFRLIRYHRRGFAGSEHPPGPTSIGEQADDAAGVLDGLGVDRTHVVGHSLGAVIALELAARRPTQVLSLSLLEPALLTGPAG